MAKTHQFTDAPSLRGFDKFAKDVARDCFSKGWTGRISAKSHLILRSPDGETTVAIAHANGSPRARGNTLAPIRRWERTQRDRTRPGR